MGKIILILEDEKVIAELYAKYLRSHGYETVLAHNGVEGLERLKKIKPDLILLDLGMPVMDGVEFYQRICGLDKRPRYPVVVLSGRIDLERMFKDLHVDGFIVKPFEGPHLLHEIEIILNMQYLKKADKDAKKVIIIDDEVKFSEKIYSVFSKAGFKASVADSGVLGVEKVMIHHPDLVIVRLGLADISGDLVVLRLQQMAKTRYIEFILYIEKNYQHDKVIMDNFSHKSGVKLMYEYEDPVELLKEANHIFQKTEEEHSELRNSFK